MLQVACRTWDPCWAQIYIFYTAEVADADAKAADVILTAYNELLTLALEYVVMMDVGYSDCLVRVTSCCPLRCDVMRRRHDFVIIATIPDSVYMSGVGLCDDFIFAKSLQLNDRPVNMANCYCLLIRALEIFLFLYVRLFAEVPRLLSHASTLPHFTSDKL